MVLSVYWLPWRLGFLSGPPGVGFISEQAGGRGMVLFFAVMAGLMLALVLTRFVERRLNMRRQLRAGGNS